MNYLKYFCLIYFILTSLLFADDSIRLNEAATFYKNQEFDKALTLYNSLHKSYPNNIDILYNLGNTYFKLNNNGYAIAYYLKALQWNPSNDDIRYNLSLARALVQKSTEESNASIITTVMAWLRLLSINTLFNITMLFLLIFLIFFRLIQLKKLNRELLSNAIVITGLFFIISLSFFSYRYFHFSQDKGVVLAKKLAVYAGPSETLSILFYIHEGYEFTISKNTGDWVEIELTNGFKGWASKSGLFKL